MRQSVRTVVATAAVWSISACGCHGPIYDPNRQHFPDAIPSRSQWKAGGDIQNPHLATDGRIDTAAIAPSGYSRASLVVDLGKPSLLNMVVVDHGADEHAYCRRLAVQTSDDGVRWVHRITVPGLRRVTNALLPTQVLARYIRLEAVEPGPGRWSVAEVYLN